MKKRKKLPRPFNLSPMKYADRLWSIIVRAPGRCELSGKDHLECSGVLQGMHIQERTSYELRHKLWNGVPGCQGHHTFYTYREKEWERFCKRYYPGRLVLNEQIPRQVKLNYHQIAYELEEELKGLIARGQLKHEYKGVDKKIVDSLT